MQLTARDLEILEALARKVRAFSVEQVARGWWTRARSPISSASRRLSTLMRAGYLREQQVYAQPPIDLPGPLTVWCEGRPAPDFGPLAWKLQSRWPKTAPLPTPVVLAAKATNDQFGGPSSRPRFSSHHATHDLHVSEVFLICRQTRPADAQAWVGEDVRPKSGYRLKDPDVLVESVERSRPLVIEFGGSSYEADHLHTFHEDCVARGRDYELW